MTEGIRKLGKYEMQSRLAQGGMGEVWKAFDSQLKRVVAIKLLRADLQHDPEFTLRFEREAQLIAALRHPNIVQIHDFDITTEDDKTVAYMVMDYVKGQTLADYIRSTSRKGNFPGYEDITYLFAMISLAMDYAHEKGMIHRDIKPANILLDQRLQTVRSMGEPILTDFGIARLQGAATGTVVGSLLGTPLYISPEQARGQHGDKRSDLYSLGIILYEMMTGVTPFRGETTMAILIQQLHEVPTPPALINHKIPPALSLVILKSIAKQPEDRYNSASELTIALADALHAPLPERFIHTLRSEARSRQLNSTPLPPINPSTLNLTPLPPVPSQPISNIQPLLPAILPPSPQNTFSYRPMPPIAHPVPFTGPTPPALISTPKQPAAAFLPKRKLISFLLLALLALLISASITTFILNKGKSATPSQNSQNVGSLQIRNLTNVNGQLLVQITTLKPLLPGHTYNAWIQTHTVDTHPPHWLLPVQNNSVNTVITVSNLQMLLSNQPLFLVTDETIPNPIVPYPTSRLYFAPLSTNSTQFPIQLCPLSDTNNVCMG
jgi:serine/threonine protein kinase